MWNLCVLTLFAALLGSRLLLVVANWSDVARHPTLAAGSRDDSSSAACGASGTHCRLVVAALYARRSACPLARYRRRSGRAAGARPRLRTNRRAARRLRLRHRNRSALGRHLHRRSCRAMERRAAWHSAASRPGLRGARFFAITAISCALAAASPPARATWPACGSWEPAWPSSSPNSGATRKAAARCSAEF